MATDGSSVKYIALIGDIVGSKQIENRREVQAWLEQQMEELNVRFSNSLVAKFTVTLGDEFQGLLSDPKPIHDILWHLESDPMATLRFGIGVGTVVTPIKQSAIGADGPAWHRARRAIEEARDKELTGGVFSGFGDAGDLALTATAWSLRDARSKLLPDQRSILGELLKGKRQIDASKDLNVSRQLVNWTITSRNLPLYLMQRQSMEAMCTHFFSL